MPRGARVRHEIENFWRSEHLANGYELVFSPHIAKRDLWEQSGHTDFYIENIVWPDEHRRSPVPAQADELSVPYYDVQVTALVLSDLPLRWAELGSVYRYERPGVLHGLLRVRGFTMDDAIIFVARDQIENELAWTLAFSVHMLKSFGFH